MAKKRTRVLRRVAPEGIPLRKAALRVSFAKTLSAFEINSIGIALHRGFRISANHVPSPSNHFHIKSSPLPHASQPVT